MLHFFLKLLLGSKMIFLHFENELLPKPSLCLPNHFNFLSASGHTFSFSRELFYLMVVVTHHECIQPWEKQICVAIVLQMKKHHDTCEISLNAGVSA
jgi:hypothetical protein